MYDEFYGFTEKPFTIVPNPSLLYPSRKHRMALTYLEYGLIEASGFIVLTGEIGTGKTTLIRHLLGKIDESLEVAVLFNTNVSPEDLLRLILSEFEIEPAGNDKSANLDRLNDFLIEKYSEGKRCLLIIDEAQNLSRASLEEVRMLSNLQTETAPLIQIAMVGQPELREKLRHPSLEQLKQRVTVSYHLGVMNRQETGEYIQHRLNKAGAKIRDLFADDAIDLIHVKSNGVPRTINILCDAALVYGYADEAEKISREIVEQVISDREDKSDAGTESYYASQDSGERIETDSFLEYRLSALESKIGKLQAMIDVHESEINERMDNASDRLIQELEKLLSEERMRSQRLEQQLADSRIELEKDREEPLSAASNETVAQSEKVQKDAGSVESNTGPEWLAGHRDESQKSENSNEIREKKSKFKWLGFSRD